MKNQESNFRWFYCEKQGQPDFCRCEKCSLVNYGRDCENNKIKEGYKNVKMITLHKSEWHSKDQDKPMYFFKCGNHAGLLFSAVTKAEFIRALEDFVESLKMSPYEITGDSILSEQIANYINTADAAAMLGRKGGKIGGSSKSDAKKKSSAENGKLGGRPKGSGKKKDEDN